MLPLSFSRLWTINIIIILFTRGGWGFWAIDKVYNLLITNLISW